VNRRINVHSLKNYRQITIQIEVVIKKSFKLIVVFIGRTLDNKRLTFLAYAEKSAINDTVIPIANSLPSERLPTLERMRQIKIRHISDSDEIAS
jgi:hypothetical protein